MTPRSLLFVVMLWFGGCAAHADQARVEPEHPDRMPMLQGEQDAAEQERQEALHNPTGEAFKPSATGPVACTNRTTSNSFGAVRTVCQ